MIRSFPRILVDDPDMTFCLNSEKCLSSVCLIDSDRVFISVQQLLQYLVHYNRPGQCFQGCVSLFMCVIHYSCVSFIIHVCHYSCVSLFIIHVRHSLFMCVIIHVCHSLFMCVIHYSCVSLFMCVIIFIY